MIFLVQVRRVNFTHKLLYEFMVAGLVFVSFFSSSVLLPMEETGPVQSSKDIAKIAVFCEGQGFPLLREGVWLREAPASGSFGQLRPLVHRTPDQILCQDWIKSFVTSASGSGDSLWAETFEKRREEEKRKKEEKRAARYGTGVGIKTKSEGPVVSERTISEDAVSFGGHVEPSFYGLTPEQTRVAGQVPSLVRQAGGKLFEPSLPTIATTSGQKIIEKPLPTTPLPPFKKMLSAPQPLVAATVSRRAPIKPLPIFPGTSVPIFPRTSLPKIAQPLTLSTPTISQTIPMGGVVSSSRAMPIEQAQANLPTNQEVAIGEGSWPLINSPASWNYKEIAFLGQALNALGRVSRVVPGVQQSLTLSNTAFKKVLDLGKKYNFVLVRIAKKDLPATISLEGLWSVILNPAGQPLGILGHHRVDDYFLMLLDRSMLPQFGGTARKPLITQLGEDLPIYSPVFDFSGIQTEVVPMAVVPTMVVPTAQDMLSVAVNFPINIVQGHPVVFMPSEERVVQQPVQPTRAMVPGVPYQDTFVAKETPKKLGTPEIKKVFPVVSREVEVKSVPLVQQPISKVAQPSVVTSSLSTPKSSTISPVPATRSLIVPIPAQVSGSPTVSQAPANMSSQSYAQWAVRWIQEFSKRIFPEVKKREEENQETAKKREEEVTEVALPKIDKQFDCELYYREIVSYDVRHELEVPEDTVKKWTSCGGPLQSDLSKAEKQEKSWVLFGSYNKILGRVKQGITSSQASLKRVKSTIFTVIGESFVAGQAYNFAHGLAEIRTYLATSIADFMQWIRGTVSPEIQKKLTRWRGLIGY